MEISENFMESKSCSRLILSPNILKTENYAVDISCDGKLFGFGYNKSVAVYSVLAFEELHCFSCNAAVQKIAFSPNKKYIACQTYEDEQIKFLVFTINESFLYMTINSDDNFSSFKYSSMFWSSESTFLWSSWNAKFQTGVVSIDSKRKFQLSGIKLDALNRPLCCFSPDENYYIAIQRTLPPTLIVYGANNFIELKSYYLQDMNDISGIVFLHNCFYLWDSPLNLNFQVWSLDGKQQHKIDSDLTEYGVRQVSFSPCGRLVAIMQFEKTDVFIYDTLTWKSVAVLNHNESLHKNKKVVALNKTYFCATKPSDKSMFNQHIFSVEQVDSTLNMETKRETTATNVDKVLCKQHFIEFSCCGQYIATYEPTLPDSIWIWNLRSNILLETLLKVNISDNKNIHPDIKWHGYKSYAAIDIGANVIIWNQETQLAYIIKNKLETPVKSIWCNTANLFIAVYTSDCLSFVF